MGPAVDLKKLRQKAAEIRQALHDLTPFASQTAEEFLADARGVAASKYHLIVAAEAAIDVCNHLAARLARRAPNSYADCFRILVEAETITPSLGERLVELAKFRNLLIHRYADIDDGRVHGVIRLVAADLNRYLEELAAVLRAQL
ncbi:MAG: DUF86 domain-containing protein [Firmicutes bacterium]|nr:DUF86 domain-containing protein [Bacillota bacterium]